MPPPLPSDVVKRTREKYIQTFEALTGAEPEVITALGADVEIRLHFLAVDDLFAVVALDPKTFRNGDLAVDGFLRFLLFAEPGHGGRL